eukprot:TRINITY_DN480_c0_g1_i1.p1 TRINITY_DN480_c0_g1~~TRINITY_DN480_c0_g1_i1.p1  ORF type:complete len:324 (+),score=109.71 TRINITY_DN480_c0_g1_i1:786-1757(+)
MHMPAIQRKVSERLGIYPNCSLTAEQLDLMWYACQFDVAVYGKTNEWCSVFGKEDIAVLEYIEDLESYYQRGYGIPLSHQISAPLLQEVVKIMDAVVEKDTESPYYFTAKSRFAHAETMLPFYALLGLFKDTEPLRADSPQEVIERRQWRDSLIGTFCTNVAFVLYNCTSTTTHNHSFAVRVLFNEEDIALPGCTQEAPFCPYEKFKKLYASQLSLNFDSLCGALSQEEEEQERELATAAAAAAQARVHAAGEAGLVSLASAWEGAVVAVEEDSDKLEIGHQHLVHLELDDQLRNERYKKKKDKKDKKDRKEKKKSKERGKSR